MFKFLLYVQNILETIEIFDNVQVENWLYFLVLSGGKPNPVFAAGSRRFRPTFFCQTKRYIDSTSGDFTTTGSATNHFFTYTTDYENNFLLSNFVDIDLKNGFYQFR